MKVCFFTENYYKGGLDTFLINLVNSWPNNEDQLYLVCNASHPGLCTLNEKIHKPLKYVLYSRVFTSSFLSGHSISKISQYFIVRVFFVFIERILRYPVLFPWYVLTLSYYFRRSPFDRLMVVNGGYPASLLCRAAIIGWALSGKKPLAVLNYHNYFEKLPWYFYIQEYIIDMIIARCCSNIITVSKSCMFSLSERKAFKNFPRFKYIYNGTIDPFIYTGCDFETKYLMPIKKYCLMLATFEERKGHAFLLEAFKNVVEVYPEVSLQISGYGRTKERNRVVALIKKLNLENKVIVSDYISDPTKLIANAALLAVPSQSYESFGLTIIEAMAVGTPIVATKIGGIPEVLSESGAGILSSSNDPIEFSEAMIKILSDDNLAKKLGRNGRKTYMQRFTADHMSEQYHEIIVGYNA